MINIMSKNIDLFLIFKYIHDLLSKTIRKYFGTWLK